jgi:hypothetical protein
VSQLIDLIQSSIIYQMQLSYTFNRYVWCGKSAAYQIKHKRSELSKIKSQLTIIESLYIETIFLVNKEQLSPEIQFYCVYLCLYNN